MSFLIHSIDDNRTAGIEYLPCSAITLLHGMALTQEGGLLVKATGATAPGYIAACNSGGACAVGEVVPVIRVNSDMVFETAFAAEASAVRPGDRVTLHTDAERVTATRSGGVAEVVHMDGTAAGSLCRVRFRAKDSSDEAENAWVTLDGDIMTDRDGNTLQWKSA